MLHLAVHAETGTVHLLRTLDFWSNKLIDEANPYTVEVVAVTLRQLVDAHHPTIIVCDIEGAEEHCCGTKLPTSVRAIIIETHTPALRVLVDEWLMAEGFLVTQSRRRTSVYAR